MYPDFQYLFQSLFGVDIPGLSVAKTFGFFVALAFLVGAYFLRNELKRKSEQGLIQPQIVEKTFYKPITNGQIAINALIGFIIGYKLVGLVSMGGSNVDPFSFLLSVDGHLLGGVAFAAIFGYMKYSDKKKLVGKTEKVEKVKVYPHERVADIIIVAAIAGFAGAKIFNALETWDHFIQNPIESLFSGSGLTYYGGLILATVALYYYCKKNKFSFKQLCDAVAPALILAYGIGRLGCHFAGDGDWGVYNSAYISNAQGQIEMIEPGQFEKIVKDNPSLFAEFGSDPAKVPHIYAPAPTEGLTFLWANNYKNNVNREGVLVQGETGYYNTMLPVAVFPTPIYEFGACLLIFLVLMAMRNRFKLPLQLFGLYLIFNGLERFLVEKIRVNYKYDWGFIHPSQAEIISSILILIGIYLLCFNPFKNKSNTVA